jgi:hypothetical protein
VKDLEGRWSEFLRRPLPFNASRLQSAPAYQPASGNREQIWSYPLLGE